MLHPEYISNYEAYTQLLESKVEWLASEVGRHRQISRNRKHKLSQLKQKLANGTHKENSCVRKKDFTSRAEAQCWLQSTEQENQYTIYPCKYCNAHHLATK